MRAITCTGYGRPTDVLRPVDLDEPAADADQVVVRVHAAALNPADWHLIRGTPYLARLQIGLRRPNFDVPGSDFSGVVEAVGPEVTGLKPGDEVYGTTFMAGFGAFAEKVTAPERLVARRPRNMSFAEAAVVPLAASTALQALRDHAGTRAGQHVLIIGASGGVGIYAVQIAKHLGAEVTAVSSTANLDFVRGLGADHVVDYTARDVTELGDRYDVVVQVAGTHGPGTLRKLLTHDGTLVQLSGDSPNRWVGPVGRIITGRLHGLRRSKTVTSFTVQPNRDDLERLTQLIESDAVRTHVGQTWRLEDVGTALEHLETGHTRGKVVVVMTSSLQDASSDPTRGTTEA